MKYVINDIIKRLTEAQKEGKELITESELIRVATPKINNIDEVISLIDKAIEKAKKDGGFLYWEISHASLTGAARLTNISRQTLYRWENKGIIGKESGYIDLIELKKNILKIKKIHELHE
jgi:DNA invertase Pin-like site-specific DNA recombinase